MYVKLFGSILHSSIWSADLATRVVWITMLAMADEYGIVHAAVSGLAREANVTEKECRRALRLLASPDKESRSPEAQGRRITAIPGGWRLINYQKYREIRTQRQFADAERQARHREAQRDMSRDAVTRHGDHKPVTEITTEAEAEAEAKEVLSAPHGAATKGHAPTANPTAVVRKPTWLTPFGNAWHAVYGGEPAYGELAKHLKPLRDAHDLGEILEHWTRYLEMTEATYVSPARFAQTYGMWGKPKRPSKDHLPGMYLTLEEQAARQAKHGHQRPEPDRAVHISQVVGKVLPDGSPTPDA